jgi:nucleoside-diphosphate-sugar epimerase
MISKNTPVLVTGATGFVGSYVVRELLKLGYANIHALKRESSKLDLLEDIIDHITLVEADLLDVMALDEILDGIEVVIHTAAMVSFRPSDKKSLMKTNVEGTANLLNLCIDRDVKRFVHVSSIAALGRKISGDVIDENSEWEASDNNSDYAISKYLSEMEVWRALAEGLDAVIINPSMILGAGFWKIGTGEIFSRVYKGMPFYPTGTNGYVDVRDVAKMTVLLMESEITGERYICSGDNVRHKEILSSIASSMGKKPPSVKISKSLIGLLSIFIDIFSLLSGGRSNLSSQSLKNAAFDSFYDNSKFIRQFDYRYIPVEKTIEDTTTLFMESQKIERNYAIFKNETGTQRG